jgi:hypothetical protein
MTGIIDPIIVGTTNPETISLEITIHETVLNKMIGIRRMILGSVLKGEMTAEERET